MSSPCLGWVECSAKPFTAVELEQIKKFIEETDQPDVTDEIRGLIELHWPWLLEKLSRRQLH